MSEPSGPAAADHGNLLAALPGAGGEEAVDRILARGELEIERIVSRGHRSPDGFWYDQQRDEWVLVVSGRAVLEIEGEDHLLELEAGGWAFLPARCRHRVAWTDPDQPTVWLAVFFS